MFHEAKDQLKPVSIEQIKDILKINAKSEFDKMIISGDNEIKRTDYLYSNIVYKKAERKLYAIKFPLFDNIKNDFSLFEGGVAKFGEKSIIKYDNIINDFSDIKGAKIKEFPSSEVSDAFVFPFDVENDEVSNIQRKYFLSKYTFKEICNKCKGNKYITCTDSICKGNHVWRCNECIGKGQVACPKCNGHGYTKCSSCYGKGKTSKTEYKNGKSYIKEEKCSTCRGRGEVSCNRCGATGKVRCKNCGGDGEIRCKKCYSDKKRYGMVDCPNCLTTGYIAYFYYVETLVEILKESKLLKSGDEFDLDKKKVLSHVKNDLSFICAYKHLNGKITDSSDEICNHLLQVYENEWDLSKNNFPMILKEEIIYQYIPVVEISYKHILTNETHKLTIIDLWDNPEILFHSNAEKLNIGVRSLSNTISGVFSKVFKTKGHLKKEDRKTEIKLMIYLARSDGKIEEQEKEFLSEQISHLKDFRNSEKKELFNLMNCAELPELTSNDVKFFDPLNGKEIIEKLTQLANADGVLDESEKNLIEKIKNLMNTE